MWSRETVSREESVSLRSTGYFDINRSDFSSSGLLGPQRKVDVTFRSVDNNSLLHALIQQASEVR